LARGGTDLMTTPMGCAVDVKAAPTDAAEAYTYASLAVDGLCQSDPEASSLCRPDCGDPCMALARPPEETGGGGASAGPPGAGSAIAGAVFVLLAIAWRQFRRIFRPCK